MLSPVSPTLRDLFYIHSSGLHMTDRTEGGIDIQEHIFSLTFASSYNDTVFAEKNVSPCILLSKLQLSLYHL